MKTLSRENLPDIANTVIESKRAKIKQWPCHTNRASECGHPCERYLVYCRTNWQDRAIHDVELEYVFELGNKIEEMALRELEDAGFEIIEQQRAFEWKELELTGHLDAKILINGMAIPLEIKGYSKYEFERLNSIDDFFNSKKVYIRKVPAQLMMYMLMSNCEYGILYLKNKQVPIPKAIWVELDYEYAESIAKKLERVNECIKNNRLPDGINDIDVCENCSFIHLCLPNIAGKELQMIEDPEFEYKLMRREELKPLVSEYNELNEEIKKLIEGKEKLMVGDFLITGKWVERKGYEVPASTYWSSKIIRLIPKVGE